MTDLPPRADDSRSAERSGAGLPPSFLDQSFDEALARLELKWMPWIGKSYGASVRKTIVLGESLYLYDGKGGREATRARIKLPGSLRSRIVSHGIEGRYRSTFLRNFERAVFLEGTPAAASRAALWSEVIFHNLVLDLLENRNKRPTNEQYKQGWLKFLELAALAGATSCIVYGNEKRKLDALLDVVPRSDVIHKPLPRVGKFRPMTVSVNSAGRQLDLIFIRHPSAFFSWKEWGKCLRATGFCPVMPSVFKAQMQAIYAEHKPLFDRLPAD